MTEGEGARYTVTFLPWLKLSASAEVNGVSLWPFPLEINSFHLSEDFKAQLRRIFDSYKDLQGNPISELAVVSFRNEPFKDLLPEEAEKIADFIRLFSFSILTENDYYRQAGRYFNSSHFQHFHQRFQLGSRWIAPQTRRREGITLHGGYQHGELKFTMPLQTVTSQEARANASLLQSLVGFVEGGTADAAAVRQTVNWFFLANSDSDSVSWQIEIIMMGSAFEALLQVQDAPGKKAALMDKLPTLFTGCLTKEVKRVGTDGKQATRSRKVWWMDEFYWLRNKIVHGGGIELKRMTWDIDEHLTIAAMILAIAVKLKLAQNGIYQLEAHDNADADAIDLFIADGNLSEDKFQKTRMESILDRASEDAWDHLHPKTEPWLVP